MRYYHVISSGHESLKTHKYAVSVIQPLGPKFPKTDESCFYGAPSNIQEIASANGIPANQRARRIEYFNKQI